MTTQEQIDEKQKELEQVNQAHQQGVATRQQALAQFVEESRARYNQLLGSIETLKTLLPEIES